MKKIEYTYSLFQRNTDIRLLHESARSYQKKNGRMKSFKIELKPLLLFLLHPAYYSLDKFMVYWLHVDFWIVWVW